MQTWEIKTIFGSSTTLF